MRRPFVYSKEENEDFKLQPSQPQQAAEPQAQQQEQPASTDTTTDQTPEVIDGEKASKFTASTVICAMPVLGKSTYCREVDESGKPKHNSLDLESSLYSRNQDGSRNEEFPGNYINVLKWHLVNMNWTYIFTACHQVVRDALKNDNINFIILYPAPERKEEILNLARERGNHEDFIKLLDENWDAWINQIQQEPNSYQLGPNEFISDALFETKLKFLKR